MIGFTPVAAFMLGTLFAFIVFALRGWARDHELETRLTDAEKLIRRARKFSTPESDFHKAATTWLIHRMGDRE